MELIKKVREVLQAIPINNPIVDVYYDEQKKIVGFVCSESFKCVSDAEGQKMIWQSLENSFGAEDLVNIEIIFHETPHERFNRISEMQANNMQLGKSNYWLHKSPDMTKYWVFVDVTKFNDEYKAVFLIINGSDNFKKGLSLTYTPEIIDFMDLDASEIDKELFNNVFENAEAEVKMEIMNKYELQTKNGLWARDNIFNYVFHQFQLVPKQLVEIVFDEKEIILIEPLLKEMENHKIKYELSKKVEMSKMLAKQKIKLGT